MGEDQVDAVHGGFGGHDHRSPFSVRWTPRDRMAFRER
jgi:hypothetical protein